MTTRRWMTLGIVPAAMLAAVALPVVLAWGDLPEPMAVHWGLDGDPNGSLPRLAELALMIGLLGAVWWAVNRVVTDAPHEAPSYTAGLFFVGGLLVAVQWLAVAANRGVVDWHASEAVDGSDVLVIAAAGIVGGLLGWLLAARAPAPDSVSRPLLDVDDPSAVVWSSRGDGPVLSLAGAGVIIAGLVVWGWTGLALGAIGLLVLAFAQVRTTISARGVVVSLGWLGLPRWTVPISDIAAAHVEHVAPMAYGGWGYRVRPGVRAVIVRGGTSLRLERRDRADLVLTVDDPETGAGLVNALKQRS